MGSFQDRLIDNMSQSSKEKRRFRHKMVQDDATAKNVINLAADMDASVNYANKTLSENYVLEK